MEKGCGRRNYPSALYLSLKRWIAAGNDRVKMLLIVVMVRMDLSNVMSVFLSDKMNMRIGKSVEGIGDFRQIYQISDQCDIMVMIDQILTILFAEGVV